MGVYQAEKGRKGTPRKDITYGKNIQFERVAYSENGEKFLTSVCRGMWEMRRDKGGRVYGGNDGGRL